MLSAYMENCHMGLSGIAVIRHYIVGSSKSNVQEAQHHSMQQRITITFIIKINE